MIREKEFAKLVEIVDVPGYQYMVINGQEVRQETHKTNVCCPECGNPIFSIDQPVDVIYMRQQFLQDSSALPRYCATCGQKLFFAYPVVDGEWEVVNEDMGN